MLGVLSALPFVFIGNLCCCLWVVIGGGVAAYLLQQTLEGPISTADAAIVGLLAGIIGAFVHYILSIPIEILIAPMERSLLQRISDMAGPMPPEFRQLLETAVGQRTNVVRIIVVQTIGLFFWLFVDAIFATLGGLLGAAIFRRQAAPGAVDRPPGEGL